MIDLIKDEVMRNFPETNRKSDEFFYLHCSKSFALALRKYFTETVLRQGFVVERTQDEPVTRFTNYQIPGLGRVNVIEDMLQGYRLECVSCENKPEAALPEHITVIQEFQHLANAYVVDKKSFKQGDILMDGRERYTIITDPMPYGDTDGSYWVYILDKPLEKPIGKKLIKEYFKN